MFSFFYLYIWKHTRKTQIVFVFKTIKNWFVFFFAVTILYMWNSFLGPNSFRKKNARLLGILRYFGWPKWSDHAVRTQSIDDVLPCRKQDKTC